MDGNEKKNLLAAYEGLRLTDVRDGMDWLGLHHVGSASPDIRPVWRTRIVGLARTARYVPTEKVIPTMTPDEYTVHAYDYWYKELAIWPFDEDIEDGDIVVLDASDTNVGLLGSMNVLDWIRRGALGVVTNGGVRDTDEIILQRSPIFSRYISQTMLQGRIEYQAKDVAVNIGGALVRPGDLVVGDGDGVLSVPIERAWEVAKYARQEADRDRETRRQMYEDLGMELDDSVLPLGGVSHE